VSEPLSQIEQRLLAKLLEGLPLKDIGQSLRLSERNVRLGVDKLRRRYRAETLAELLEKVRRAE
jgi:FixJ family two-component response regulator